MGFQSRDIDEGIARSGGAQRVNEQPLPTTTQAVIDAIVSKQEQGTQGGGAGDDLETMCVHCLYVCVWGCVCAVCAALWLRYGS